MADLVNKTAVWLLMLTIIILFFSMTVLMIATSDNRPLVVPGIFYLNTLILALSSVVLHRVWQLRTTEMAPRLLKFVVGLGFLFLLSQSWGWAQLWEQGLSFMAGNRRAAYLYVLTGLHALHLIAGMISLLLLSLWFRRWGDRYLEAAVYFWHFLGVLWLYLLGVLVLA